MEKLNIICVDDQREVLNTVRQDLIPLTSWLTIEECESADEALELMDELDACGEHIAVVITDHVMPEKSGVELLTALSNDSRFVMTRKILLTGQATHTDTINAINQAGLDRYFEKPWKSSQLLDTVRALVTEYIFDRGLEYSEFQKHLDSEVVLRRLR